MFDCVSHSVVVGDERVGGGRPGSSFSRISNDAPQRSRRNRVTDLPYRSDSAIVGVLAGPRGAFILRSPRHPPGIFLGLVEAGEPITAMYEAVPSSFGTTSVSCSLRGVVTSGA
jgi:hypothetical protein